MDYFLCLFITYGPSFTPIILILTVLFSYGQLRQMKKTSQAQNAVVLMKDLLIPRLREDRKFLLRERENHFRNKPIDEWKEHEKDAVERVCASYDLAGIMIQEGLVPKEIIVKNWWHSIIGCYEWSSPLINYRQEKHGKDFWDDFKWLYEKAKESIKNQNRVKEGNLTNGSKQGKGNVSEWIP